MTPSQRTQIPYHPHLYVFDKRRAQAHLLGPAHGDISVVQETAFLKSRGQLTSIKQKLGTPYSFPAAINAPVALPGFTKNRPSSSYASNLPVPPHSKISTSICLAAIRRESASPGGTMVWPCVNPIRKLPCVTTLESGRLGVSTSKSPLTSWRSGASWRRNSKAERSVRLPRQRICPIFPGVRSFLN